MGPYPLNSFCGVTSCQYFVYTPAEGNLLQRTVHQLTHINRTGSKIMTIEFTHELIKGLKLVAQMLLMDGDRYFTEIHTVLYNIAKCVQKYSFS